MTRQTPIELSLVPLARGQPLLLLVEPPESGRSDPDGQAYFVEPRRYRGRLVAREGNLLWVDLLPGQVEADPLHHGESALVQTWRDMDARYLLRTNVEVIEGAAVGFVGLRVHACTRWQEREFVRVPVLTDPMPATLVDHRGRELPIRLQVTDLSATGLRCVITLLQSLPPGEGRTGGAPRPGDEVLGQLRLPEAAQTHAFRARIVRIVTEAAERTAWSVGAMFVELAPTAREQLIRFALHVQRELRRRGVLA